MLQQVNNNVKSVLEVKRVSGIRLRRAGPFITGRAEISVDPRTPIEEADHIAEKVKRVLEQNIPSLRDFVVLPSSAKQVVEDKRKKEEEEH